MINIFCHKYDDLVMSDEIMSKDHCQIASPVVRFVTAILKNAAWSTKNINHWQAKELILISKSPLCLLMI